MAQGLTIGRVVANYLLSALYVAMTFALAWLLAWLAMRNFPVLAGARARLIAFLLGSGFLLVAGIGRLGWSLQTYGGNTPPELLDQIIFWFLSFVGTLLLIYDFAIGRL